MEIGECEDTTQLLVFLTENDQDTMKVLSLFNEDDVQLYESHLMGSFQNVNDLDLHGLSLASNGAQLSCPKGLEKLSLTKMNLCSDNLQRIIKATSKIHV